LLRRPGEIVTREELRQQLWPADTFVDFDHSLNAAIERLRDALGESAENPALSGCAACDLFQGQGPPIIPAAGPVSAVLQLFREIRDVDKVAHRRDIRAGNYVFQLSHIARPRMLQHDRLCAPR